MNGAHDLGGMDGFGPIDPEPDEPVFHAEWERRAFALTLALGLHGKWNIDMSRYYRENRDPRDYLGSSYYELWFKALDQLVREKGLLEDASLKAYDAETAVSLVQSRKGAAKIEPGVAAKFAVGDRVRVANRHPKTHTRMPRYCRGKAGVVHLDHGTYVFPDTHALGLGPKPQHCYSVRFSAEELWGGPARDSVHIDLWDDYLEKA
jgi:nitrile hydratase beta subunit